VAGLLLPGSGSALDFSSPELPWAIIDRPYTPPALNVYGAARCPAGDASFTAEGALPPGLGITALGQITGVPSKIGVYRFVVRAADACGATAKPVSVLVTGAPILVLRGDTLEFHYRRGGAIPAPQALLVNGTWPNRAYYIDWPDAVWLHAIPRAGRTPKLGAALESDRVEISVEPGSLAPGSYEAKLRFWTWQGANVPTARVRLVIE
jgi:putative Ig domain-containing protein